MSTKPHSFDHYGAQYGHFSSRLRAEIRAETFGEDLGQNSWLTTDEQDLLISWLGLSAGSKLLDVACGAGGPTLRIARQTGCEAHGVDVHEEAIAEASARSEREGMSERVAFRRADARLPLPFTDASFDAVICIDAVNHLPDRPRVFADWARVLRPGGILVFTDPVVVTGPVTNEEMAIRGSIGFFLFVPIGTDERLLAEAGFQVEAVMDRTENMALIAGRWHASRAVRAADLRAIEDATMFENQQRFYEVAARLAGERRLSRFAFRARRS